MKRETENIRIPAPTVLSGLAGGTAVADEAVALGKLFLPLDAARDYLARNAAHVLGVVSYGLDAPFVVADLPQARVAMDQLGAEPMLEIWTTDEVVSTGKTGDITWARSADLLFGCFRPSERCLGLEDGTRRAYGELFSLLEAQRLPSLLRVWNYFPAINADEDDGLERYKHFCIGRHDVFAQYRRLDVADIPAATAVGSRGGEFSLYFLAASRGGLAVENDRQVSAYDYPPQYGPRSPLFSRATLVPWLGEPLLFISGTASIVGHASTCLGDAAQQTEETLNNISHVLRQAFAHGGGFGQLRALKVYVRHRRDYPAIRAVVDKAVGAAVPSMYLLSDICRSELLLEIEAVAGTL